MSPHACVHAVSSSQISSSNSCTLAAVQTDGLGLFLGTEAPVMMPNGAVFSFLPCHFLLLQTGYVADALSSLDMLTSAITQASV